MKDIEERIKEINDMFKRDEPIKIKYTPAINCEWLSIYDGVFRKPEPKRNEIRNIYANKKAKTVVVIFNDNEKMVFRLSKGDTWDLDKVILMAIVRKEKRLNKSQYRKFMKKQNIKCGE